MANVWGVHTKDDRLFLEDKVIAMGWKEMQDLSKLGDSRDAFKAHYTKIYPNDKKGAIAPCAGMLYRFIHEIQIGDYVIYPSKPSREIYIGSVEGEYMYNPAASEYVHQRKVKWIKHVPRTAFSQGALYESGSALTLFTIKNYADEYLSALNKDFKINVDPEGNEDDTVAATAEDIIDATKDFVLKELSRKLKGYDLEDFIADLLQAMGYRTTLSPHGGDSGIDITAYKDELPPRILVQVKSGDGDISEKTLQSLKGAMKEGDYGLFITLANYTKNARKYLEITPIIRGINGSELVDLILKYYGALSDKHRKIVPLKMVYIPVPQED